MAVYSATRRDVLSGIGVSLTALPLLAQTRPGAPVTIGVSDTPRQTFKGFGVSQNNVHNHIMRLPAELRARLLHTIYTALPVSIYKVWTDSGASKNASEMAQNFRTIHIDSGLLDLVRSHGDMALLLAPGQGETPTMGMAEYGRKLGDFARIMRDENGLLFDVSGISNEPLHFTSAQLIDAIVNYRRTLDRHGLQSMKLVGHEPASINRDALQTFNAIDAHAEARRSLGGWATQSYNMATIAEAAPLLLTKDHWVTEAGRGVADGVLDNPATIEAMDAATVAARFIGDVNHSAAYWIWHQGAWNEDQPTGSRSMHALAIATRDGDVRTFARHTYLRQLLALFPTGSVFRQCTSSHDGTMGWAYGRKPALAAACAIAPDGRTRFAAVNCTSIMDSKIARFEPARTIEVNARLPASPGQRLSFSIIGPDGAERSAGSLAAGDGELAIRLAPLELLSVVGS